MSEGIENKTKMTESVTVPRGERWFFFFFRLLSLGVATVDHQSPPHPASSFLLCHTNPAWTSSLHPWTSSEVFLFFSSLATPSPTSFVQYIHYPFSTHCSAVFKLINLALRYSFLILFILVIQNENLSIFTSAISSSTSCLPMSATIYKPYIIAGLFMIF